jgi:alkylation response protein AidB-like acyl-CoA dehydrogenase
MDFALTEEQQMMRDAARRFAEERIRPTMEEDEKNSYYRKELVLEMAELGFFGCLAPEEYGGTEVGHLAASIMAMDVSFDSAYEKLAALTGGNIPKRQLEELVVRAAQDFDAYYDDVQCERIQHPPDFGPGDIF